MSFTYESRKQKAIRNLNAPSREVAHAAFDALWQPLEPVMLARAIGKLMNRPDAEDVVAHVRHQIWRRRDHLATLTESEFDFYVWAIHANKSIDFLKRRHRETVTPSDLLAVQHQRIDEIADQAKANAEARLLQMVPVLRERLLPQLVRQQPTILREVAVRLDDGWVRLGPVCDVVSVSLPSRRGESLRPGYVRAEWYAIRYKLDQMLREEGMRPKTGAVRALMLAIGRSSHDSDLSPLQKTTQATR